jgi:hypothetical protein
MKKYKRPEVLLNAQNNWRGLDKNKSATVIVEPERSLPNKYLQVTFTLDSLTMPGTVSIKVTAWSKYKMLYESKFIRLKPMQRRRLHIPVSTHGLTPIYKLVITTHKDIILLVSIRAK